MGNRITYLDVAKGIGMCLVLFGHAPWRVGGNDNYPFLNCVVCFHMPLFVFLSGVLFNGGYMKKVNRLLVPLVSFSFILSWLLPILLKWFGWGVLRTHSPLKELWTEVGFGPMWFLWSLFLMSCCGVLLMRGHRNLMLAVTALMSLCGAWLIEFKIGLPFFVDTTIVLFPWFLVGVLLSTYMKGFALSRRTAVSLSIIGFTLLYFVQGYASYAHFRFGMPLWKVVMSAVVGVFSVVMVSVAIQRSNFLEFVGRNSLIVLCLHFPIQELLAIPLNRFVGNLDVRTFICFSLSLIFSCLLAFPVKRYLPHLSGMKPLFKM